ncbi:MAG TPA: type II secretion system protein [Gemmatimonadales bacterium]|nr:type II secretion system protein [Gemmatimonadales bacterium]
MSDRRGFTLIELLIVVSILGVLASIAVPRVQAARAHARAADVLGALRAVRVAATIYYDSANAWPPSGANGAVPAGLAGYLPRNGNGIFTGSGWTLRWRSRTVWNGSSFSVQGTMQVRTSDPLLCLPLATLMGGPSSTVSISCNGGNGRITQTVER